MNTKKFFTTISLLALGVALSVGLSYAAIWTSPTGAAPTGSIDTPITALIYNQDKPGGLSVNTFAVLGDATLKQQAFFRGPVKGIDVGSSNPTLEIGGTSSNGTPRVVATTATGNWNSGATIGATELKNTTLNTLCSNDQGHIVLCPQKNLPPIEPTQGPITVVNNFDLAGNGRITNITGTWYTLQPQSGVVFPVGPNETRTGTHNAVSSFSVAVNVPSTASVVLSVNGADTCMEHIGSGAHTFNFTNTTIASADQVDITLEPGSTCN